MLARADGKASAELRRRRTSPPGWRQQSRSPLNIADLTLDLRKSVVVAGSIGPCHISAFAEALRLNTMFSEAFQLDSESAMCFRMVSAM
jgi:hypothetical protein